MVMIIYDLGATFVTIRKYAKQPQLRIQAYKKIIIIENTQTLLGLVDAYNLKIKMLALPKSSLKHR